MKAGIFYGPHDIRVEEVPDPTVVWTPPNKRHWHGATAKTAMTHIAIQEALDGKVGEWNEKVSDEEYNNH